MSYYIYQLTYRNIVLYIGSGCKDRIDHVMSCSSHNQYLNRFFALGYVSDDITLEKTHQNLSKQDSLDMERELIKNKQPLFNTVYTDNFGAIHKKRVEYYLGQHQFNRMFDVLKWGKSQDYIDIYKNQIEMLNEYTAKLEDENMRLKSIIKNIDSTTRTGGQSEFIMREVA